MDIPRRDFTPRFELMETRWHPICTDKAERPLAAIVPLPRASNHSLLPFLLSRSFVRRSSILVLRDHDDSAAFPLHRWIKWLHVAAYSSTRKASITRDPVISETGRIANDVSARRVSRSTYNRYVHDSYEIRWRQGWWLCSDIRKELEFVKFAFNMLVIRCLWLWFINLSRAMQVVRVKYERCTAISFI